MTMSSPFYEYERLDSLKALFSSAPARVSFEFFPPKTAPMAEKLWESLQLLAPLRPAFVSVTYGAGGSTRDRTHATVKRILSETSLTPAAHLTCVGATREAIDAVALAYWESGVRHIVALRGDLPAGSGGTYTPYPGGYAYASDLVAGLRRIADFEISVAAYPETHPEANTPADDLDNLKRKIDAGASRAITQFFFEVDAYLRFLERARGAGITVPIVPGILPVTNYVQLKRFAGICGAKVPDWLTSLFEGSDANPELRGLLAAAIAVEQCRLLRAAGVEEFHFYTLNRAKLTLAICHILGIRAPLPARP
jgi:methylenetetrahydrofolate reductase (NADPH)